MANDIKKYVGPDSLSAILNNIESTYSKKAHMHSIVVDTTLTQSGKAADAKAVGNALAEKQPIGNYLTSYTETDPTVPAWAKASTKPTYTASEVGADASGTANSLISAHNTATDAHADIRTALNNKLSSSELQTAINASLAQAKASGEFDGATGKTAYAYAREGGYAGTEEEFTQKMAEEIPDALPNPKYLTFVDGLSVNNVDYYDGSQEKNLFLRKVIYIQITQNEDGSWSASEKFQAIAELIGMGWPVCCIVDGLVCPFIEFDDACLVFAITMALGDCFQTCIVSITSDNSVEVDFAETTALPNPNALTINGVSYDGSETKDFTDAINTMIDSKLASITNAEEVPF